MEDNISTIIKTTASIEKKFKIKYISTLQPASNDVLLKVKQRVRRRFFPLYNKKHNRWVSSLYASHVRNNEEVPHYLKEINPIVGHGVFAKEKIPHLAYIGEYAGELRARRGRKDRGNDYIFGYMVGIFGTPWIIDAKRKGNFTRFLNHSYSPNISSRGIVIDGIYHVIFFANRSIEKDQQLTYDYGPTYWNKRPYPQNI